MLCNHQVKIPYTWNTCDCTNLNYLIKYIYIFLKSYELWY